MSGDARGDVREDGGEDATRTAGAADVVRRATAFVRSRLAVRPSAGIILGTGLGELTRQIQGATSIAYRDIPGFPACTALSHAGRLVAGELGGAAVVVFEGRCHLYEGYAWDDVTLPVRLMRGLGAELLIVSNASGGVNPQLESGEILAIVDHIDLLSRRGSPVRNSVRNSVRSSAASGVGANGAARNGAGLADSGAFCGGRSAYDERLVALALEVARRDGFPARRGVYAAFTGPNYETRAEYRMLRRIGADVVGMSTVPEVLAAAAEGMRVLGLSVVTNVARPDALGKTTGEEVVAAARKAESRLRAIVLAALGEERSK